jgi:hypothetical protein
MNRSELRTAVYERTGEPSDSSLVTSTVLNGFIQSAIDLYSTQADWPWLQESASVAVSSGTATYAVPADWARTRFMRRDDRFPLRAFSLEELYTRWPDDASSGPPTEFAIDEETLIFRPTPDGSYSVTHGYLKNEPVLAADDASPLLPRRYHYGLVDYASYLVFRRTGNRTEAQLARDEWETWIRSMMDDRRRIDGPMRIRVRPGGWL